MVIRNLDPNIQIEMINLEIEISTFYISKTPSLFQGHKIFKKT